jgi:uncharacterized membrane protein YedE/YeeE
MRSLVYILLGLVFGIVMYKSETASWFRIYEMFRFESFHMYGFIGSALVIGVLGVWWMKKSEMKNVEGEKIKLPNKDKSISRYLIGGIFFGMGWALVGACPGPIFVLLGSGYFSMIIVILGALLGTYLYGIIRKNLPH